MDDWKESWKTHRERSRKRFYLKYAVPGIAFLALAVWEVWLVLRDRRAGRTRPVYSPTMNVAFVILALSNVFRAVAEPTGFNAGMAVCWSILGALYAVKAVREFRAADIKKEEVQHE